MVKSWDRYFVLCFPSDWLGDLGHVCDFWVCVLYLKTISTSNSLQKQLDSINA